MLFFNVLSFICGEQLSGTGPKPEVPIGNRRGKVLWGLSSGPGQKGRGKIFGCGVTPGLTIEARRAGENRVRAHF